MTKVAGSQVVVDKYVNPGLGGVIPRDVDLGYVEVRENGRVRMNRGVVYVSDADLNDDDRINGSDYAVFQGCMSGEKVPADPACMN